jgi:hypothetical protein
MLLLVLVSGCGERPSMVPLRGTVRLDGRPLPNATVSFIAQGASGRDAFGFTDANGVFQLSTLKSGDGALPGKYKVVVQPVDQTDADVVVAPPWAKTRSAATTNRKPNRSPVVLPPRYTQADQTVFVQEVPSSGDVVFELQSK